MGTPCDLLSLAQTGRLLHGVTIPWLYRDCVLDFDVLKRRTTAMLLQCLLKNVAGRPSVILYIRTLKITWQDSATQKRRRRLKSNILSAIAELIPYMVNLKRFWYFRCCNETLNPSRSLLNSVQLAGIRAGTTSDHSLPFHP